MTPQQLGDLLDYHYWARDRLLDAAARLPADELTRDLGSSFKSVRDTLAHTLNAEWIWCERWQGRAPAMRPLDLFIDIPALRDAWRDQETLIRAVVDSFALGPDGLERVVEYRDLKGTAWRQVFWHMVQHVVNHASYHRGQVTTMLRQLGVQPAEPMDLIAFYRLRHPAGN